MTEIVIRIQDEEKAALLRELLAALSFVELVSEDEARTANGQHSDFFAIAGIWADRDVSLESIRSQAWPGR